MEQTAIAEQRLTAWRSLLDTHAVLIAGVAQAFAEEDLPPLTWYDVLSAVQRAPDHIARPRDIGCGVAMSRSGMTRLLDRIEAAGLVERRACDVDRRGTFVHLTKAGEAMLERMRPVYERELQVSFAGLLSDEEAETLSRLLARVGAGA
jgi:DNA-binding MarR family transcriptional regulator